MEQKFQSDKNIHKQFKAIARIPKTDLKNTKKIGNGSFGEVYSALWNNKEVAIKKLIKDSFLFSSDDIKYFQREAVFMATLQCPYVMQLYGISKDNQNKQVVYSLIMPYMARGSLHEVLKDKNLTWDLREKIAIEIGKGLTYLHKNSIIHRDIKSPNILMAENYSPRIADFGLARYEFTDTVRTDYTPLWAAPEVLNNEQATLKSDIYSYGIVLWEIGSLKILFEDIKTHPELCLRVLINKERPVIPKECPQEYATQIKAAWSHEPKDRPSASSLVQALKAARYKSRKLNTTPTVYDNFFQTHLDSALKEKAVSIEPQNPYQLMPLIKEKAKTVLDFYSSSPVNVHNVSSIDMIFNPENFRKYEHYIEEQKSASKKAYSNPDPSLAEEKNRILTVAFQQTLYPSDSSFSGCTMLAWTAVDSDKLHQIFSEGYSKPITGCLGKGFYGNSTASSTHPYSKDGYFLVLNLMNFNKKSLLPVTVKEAKVLKKNPNAYPDFNARFALINGEKKNYVCEKNESFTHTKIMAKEAKAILPFALVTLQKNSIPEPFTSSKEIVYQQGLSFFNKNEYIQAYNCFLFAANEKYPAAYVWLYLLHQQDGWIGPKNIKKMEKYLAYAKKYSDWFYDQANKTSDPISKFNYALLINEIDPGQSETLIFNLAVKQNLAIAQYVSGGILFNRKQFKAARDFYALASTNGCKEGLYKAAICDLHYEDPEETFIFLQEKARENTLACFGLGLCYYNGWGVTQNEMQASRLFEQAAKEGKLAEANLMLGHCNKDGRGVPVNLMQAIEYYNKAIVGYDVGNYLKQCYEEITPSNNTSYFKFFKPDFQESSKSAATKPGNLPKV